jgi:hypothetical protein
MVKFETSDSTISKQNVILEDIVSQQHIVKVKRCLFHSSNIRGKYSDDLLRSLIFYELIYPLHIRF